MSAPAEDQSTRYRMRDLCELTGLDRQAIHFYIKEELLPPGHKTGRNMAWYDDEHVRRLKLIRKLQHERFLPLRAIKAVLDDEADGFSPAQRRFLGELKGRLPRALADDAAARETVPADALLARTGLDPDDLDRMVARGDVGLATGPDGELRVAAADAWKAELWAAMRAAGFRRELGFEVDDIDVYEEAVRRLVRVEAERLATRLAHLPADEAARMIERALPLVQTLLTRLHTARIQEILAPL